VLPFLSKGMYVASVKRSSFEGIRIEEKLAARVKKVGVKNVLDAKTSLDIINMARLQSNDWLEAKFEIDEKEVKDDIDWCEDLIEDDFESEKSLKEAENLDRVYLQISSAEKHFQRQVQGQESAIYKHTLAGRHSLIKAAQGKLNKITERFNQRKAELEIQQIFKSSLDDVCQILFKVAD
jgi:hypothetical protein